MRTTTCATDRSSSSATTWAIATSSPCPISIFPKNASAVPSGGIAIHESSLSGGGNCGGGAAACAKAVETSNVLAEMTKAPAASNRSRRDKT